MPPIRVLIVDDSPLASGVLTTILESDPEIRVIGVARDGRDAIEQVPALKPDLVTMDVWMPRLDGFAAVEQLMAYHPTPILVITASLARQDVDISLRMLAAGALDVIEKPSRLDDAAWERACKALVQRVKVLARVRVVTHLRGRRQPAPEANGVPTTPPAARPLLPPAPPPPPTTPPKLDARSRQEAAVLRMAGRRRGNTEPFANLPPHAKPGSGHRYELVAIASSTGGPQALLKVLRGLPAPFGTPILVVQHIAAGFTQGLADWLGRESGRVVRIAREGDRPEAGTVLLAPDGLHMLVGSNGKITLSEGTPREIRPSADVTMRSVAASFGNRAVGIILTGMGRDGAEGLRAMRLAGAYTIAQDEPSSIIFGMPRAAIGLGVIDEVLPLETIAARLVGIVGG
ncbi:MAG TPA: chemotaxis-specific protein-glutamate methyltransferase CheB [Chloroflexia bacterium]|nr:chemotaxis-specific protein-glutamate methyltransferase CheB [Chloroflexia bacterium]